MPQPSTDRLALLYRLSQTFNSSLDLTQVLDQVIDEVIAATRAERGFLMLRGEDGILEFQVARGIEQKTIESPVFQVSRGIIDKVAQEGRPLLSSDAQSDAWLGGRASVVGLGLRSVLCVPLLLKGATIGVIYVDNRLQSGIFSLDDLELLGAIASSASIAIENARLYRVAVEKGRMERELQVARQVQASLMPAELPVLSGWEFAAYWQPALEVGGDFYDFISVDSRRVGVMIADVSDKGMGAALFMTLTRSIARASVVASRSVDQSITQANRLICADAAGGMFVTMFYGELDHASGSFTYVNAGHNPPLIFHSRENRLGELVRTGLPLGVDDSLPMKQGAEPLLPGDFVFMYTDGITEAINPEEEEFGVKRLRQVVLDSSHKTGAEMVRMIRQELQDYVRDAPQSDDITIVVIKRTDEREIGFG